MGYQRRVHGDSRQLDLSLKSPKLNHARNMAKLFVILALAALASAAPFEDGPAKIDLKKVEISSDLKGKFFGDTADTDWAMEVDTTTLTIGTSTKTSTTNSSLLRPRTTRQQPRLLRRRLQPVLPR